MPKFEAKNLRGLLAVLLLGYSGCASQHWCELPDDLADGFSQTQLGWELQDVCHGCASGSCDGDDCGVCVYDDDVYPEEPAQPRRPRIEVGPPPVSYEPPMPPEFLPVPVSNVWGATGGR